jgi:serine/threonine protein kinase
MNENEESINSEVTDIEDEEEDIEIIGLLGEGSYGCVYEAISSKTGEKVAVKVVEGSNELERYFIH